MAPLVLSTPRLVVRTLAPDDGARVAAYLVATRAYFAPWSPEAPDAFYTAEAQAERLRRDERARADDRGLRLWLLEPGGGGEPIGEIGLSNIVRGAFQSCHLGYRIAEDHGGRGLMREALTAALAYAFGPLGLHRVEANIMPHNRRSIRLVEGLGFHYEGYAPRYLHIAGDWRDHLHYARLSPADPGAAGPPSRV